MSKVKQEKPVAAVDCGVFTCTCGEVSPKSLYAVAQLTMGHTLIYTCKHCGATWEVTSRYAFRKRKGKKVKQ